MKQIKKFIFLFFLFFYKREPISPITNKIPSNPNSELMNNKIALSLCFIIVLKEDIPKIINIANGKSPINGGIDDEVAIAIQYCMYIAIKPANDNQKEILPIFVFGKKYNFFCFSIY